MPALASTAARDAAESTDADADASTSASDAHAPSLYGRLAQNLNTAGIALFFRSAVTDRALAIPQLSCADISRVDWAHLKALGFLGVVFDKDNTLTAPYELTVHERAREGLERCIATFGASNVGAYSNSAGLTQYDPDGAEADALERALGIAFIRHATKKPAGDCLDVIRHFQGCDSAKKLIFVGDRYYTDVVYGNRHGMFTIRVEPFTLKGESIAIRSARTLEQSFVALWRYLGVVPSPHERLFPGARRPDNVGAREWTPVQGEAAYENLRKCVL